MENKLKYKNKIYKKMLVFLLIIPFIITTIFNQSSIVEASELNFSVSAVIPDNQVDKKQTYFDLRMKPKQKQTLDVIMKNDTKKDVIVEPKFNPAITNNNGIIDYSQSDSILDETLKINLEDIVSIEKEITVPAGKSKIMNIQLDMPEEEFDGILLGGIHFEEKESDKDKDQEDVQIENKFAYIIGLKVSMNDKEIAPNLELNKVEAGQINFRNAVKANLQNTESTIIKPLSVNAKIYKEKGDKVLFESTQEDLRMAPNSNFDYGIRWDDKEFKSGTYRLELTATNKTEEWSWTETFKINAGEAKEYNKVAVDIEKDYTLWYIIGGGLILVLLLVIVFLLGRKTKYEAK